MPGSVSNNVRRKRRLLRVERRIIVRRYTYVDPDKMIAARTAGASPWELHERAHAGEFAPPQPYDPRVLL
jgi:hypothetical protein